MTTRGRQQQPLVVRSWCSPGYLPHDEIGPEQDQGNSREVSSALTPPLADPGAQRLDLGDAEPLVEKNYGDSFEDTTPESVLAGLGGGRLIIAGAQTDACIRSTLHGALARGYVRRTLTRGQHPQPENAAAAFSSCCGLGR